MLWLWLILVLVALLVILNRLIGSYNENYWKKRGAAFFEDNKVLGPILNYVLQDRPIFQVFEDVYKKYYDEPAVGYGSFLTPSIFVKDPTNMLHVLQNDFNSFNHRGMEPAEGDLLSDNVLFQYGPRWKLVRQSMTPIFTSSKLKNMYYIIDKSAQDFVEYLKKNPEALKGNVYDTLSQFCSAAISGAVFGIGTESTFDSPLLSLARKTLVVSFFNNVKIAIILMMPRIAKLFRLKFFAEHEKFFVGAVRKLLQERRANNVKMHDFADLCLSIEEKGKMIDKNTNYEIEPTVELFAAQAFFFFIAGVEPCALAANGTLLELGRNPEYLKLVHEEIDSVFEQHGQLNFDIVSGMEVLDKVFNEAMRINPSVATLTRRCIKDTVLPVGNIRIDKGTQIILPVYNVHMDERYFPEPEKFDPERWAPGGNGNKDHFMPFGKGNRLCIGARYAAVQVKAGLVHLLRHFTVKTHVMPGPPKYKKHTTQVMLLNAKIELIPRNIN